MTTPPPPAPRSSAAPDPTRHPDDRTTVPSADFLTVDVYDHPVRRTPAQRRAAKAALAGPLPGLRASTVNHADNGTTHLVPRLSGTCLVLAWDSREAAEDAWAGPLRAALRRPGDFRMDGEVARSRVERDGDDWYGWRPSAEGAEGIGRGEPLVAVVHGVLRPRHLTTFLKDNLHAASRAAHHPGHRGSVDVFSKVPFEHTSISLWSSLEQAQDFAYKPGGHAHGMKRARELDTHHTGVYLQVRPLASAGGLGRDAPSYPELPPTAR
ncbi:unannotated protein [freshwater metagenome]|uniref:Unannotated protein n=1 Tax=freshwater metagenome TaxID=449393 RepID=A0A6J7JIB4_9ZZZZ